MKRILLFLLLIAPFFSFSQTKNFKKDMSDALNLLADGKTVLAYQKIKQVRAQMQTFDTLYPKLIEHSIEIEVLGFYYEDAIEDLRLQMRLDPAFKEDNLMEVGRLSHLLGRFKPAMDAYMEVATINRNNKMVFLQTASVMLDSGLYQFALTILQNNPNKGIANNEPFLYARAFYGLKKFPEATKYLKMYLLTESGRQDFEAHLLNALILKEQGDQSAACTSIKRALESLTINKTEEKMRLVPGNAQNYWVFTHLYAKMADVKRYKAEWCK